MKLFGNTGPTAHDKFRAYGRALTKVVGFTRILTAPARGFSPSRETILLAENALRGAEVCSLNVGNFSRTKSA